MVDAQELEIDGERHSCKFKTDKGNSKNGNYEIYEFQDSQGPYFVAYVGTYKVNIGSRAVDTLCSRDKIPRNFKEKKEKIDAQKKEQARVEKLKAAKIADWIWNRYESFCQGDSKYLQRKKLLDKNLYGLKIKQKINLETKEREKQLLVPMRKIDGTLVGVQTIDDATGDKKFLKNTDKKGSMFKVGMGEPADTYYVCEGVATGISVHEATGAIVFCAFDAGNLIHVVGDLVDKYPTKQLVIAADNDHEKELECKGNAGILKGGKAASKYMLKMVYPQDFKGSDWNDYHCQFGIEETKRKIESAVGQAVIPFHPIGISIDTQETMFHFAVADISLPNPYYYRRSFKGFDRKACYTLADLDYWSEHFYSEKNHFDIPSAEDYLIKRCKKLGILSVGQEDKGIGFWKGKTKDVVHLNDGFKVIEATYSKDGVKLRRLRYDDFSQGFFKLELLAKHQSDENPNMSGMSQKELDEIYESFTYLPYEHDKDAMWAYSDLIKGIVGSILPKRTNMQIIGPTGVGKSQDLKLRKRYAKHFFSYYKGNTTEAALRQGGHSSARGMLFDEFETQKYNAANLQKINDLTKLSFDGEDIPITKGTANQSGTIDYYFRSACTFYSIRKSRSDEADQNRIVYIPFSKNRHAETWRKKGLQEVHKKPFGLDKTQRLAVEALKRMPLILEWFEALKERLSLLTNDDGKHFDSRVIEGHSMLIAAGCAMRGYDLSRIDEVLIDYVEYKIKDSVREIRPAYEEMLGLIMDSQVTVHGPAGTIRKSISNIVLSGMDKADESVLPDYGLKIIKPRKNIYSTQDKDHEGEPLVSAGKSYLAFFYGHNALLKLVGDKYAQSIKETLMTIENSAIIKQKPFKNANAKYCVAVPLEFFQQNEDEKNSENSPKTSHSNLYNLKA